MDIPVEHEDGAPPEDAPEETKLTFWEQLGLFVGALLQGVP